MRPRPLKVFLCHAHEDHRAVHVLYSALRRDGVDAWLDKENLLPGQDWPNEIRKAVLQSNIIIVCLSRRFNERKGFRHEELRIALEKAKSIADDEIFIIPARLERCDMPVVLRHLQRVDLFAAGGHKKLIEVIRKID